MIGQTISHYKILEKLGQGGMGVVYKAEDTKLKRPVALKFLPPDLTRDEEANQRFINEARAASALDHPNICTIYEIDETDDGQLFIAMACYEGETLNKKVGSDNLSVSSTIEIAIQIAQGLAKAHEKGIVHRDIKPANIFVTSDGLVKILDFGLAKLAGAVRLTKTDSPIGTPAYMSPEQLQGLDADHRSDIWSLGVTIYEVLTGQLPFHGEHMPTVVYSILHEDPKPIAGLQIGIAKALIQIVGKAMAKSPDDRYRLAEELLLDLHAISGEMRPVSGIPPVKRHGDKNIFTGTGDMIIHNPLPLPPPATKDRADLLILLNKVKTFWIEGVLEKSVHSAIFLELGKETRPQAVEHPWEMVLELPDQTNQLLPSNTKIFDVFEKMNSTMLILGEPGSGKTITLLELTRDLITRAEADSNQPIPVVFNLSSWTDKRQLLDDWLATELSSKYQIPRKIGRAWLIDNRILPLLDGLDEVKSENRAACVEALNQFGKTFGLPGYVICCRIKEYTILPVRLKLNGAICLQPLTIAQIKTYLKAGGDKFAVLRAAFEKDIALQELAQSPLMLSIISLAYQDLRPTDLTNTVPNIDTDPRKHLFNTYIQRIFLRKGKIEQPYLKHQVIHWLSWLAKKMKEHSQTVFLIENIQTIWLQSRWERFLFTLSIFAFLGITAGLIAYSYFSTNQFKELSGLGDVVVSYETHHWISASVIWTFIIWLVRALRTKRRDKLKSKRTGPPYLENTYNVAIYWISWLLIWTVIYLHTWRLDFSLQRAAPFMLIGIIVATLVEFWDKRRPGSIDHVQTIEMIGWSWTDAKKGCRGGLIVALCVWCIWVAVAIPTWDDIAELRQLFTHERFYRYSFRNWFLGVIAGAIYQGFSSRISETKSLPNQGIKLSMRNAIISGLTFGLVFGIMHVLIWVAFERPAKTVLNAGLFSFLNFFIITAIWYGGLDFLLHYVLRLMLYLEGNTPRRYAHFLDYAASLIFLQKVGGGYIFIHRLLLEHFAEMGDARKRA